MKFFAPPHHSFRPGSMALMAIATASLGLSVGAAPSSAQTCTPLRVVDSGATEVEKTVSPLSFLVTNTNWNTDFIVPSDTQFNSFVATVTSSQGTTYDVFVNLKYNDDTVDEAYRAENTNLPVGDPLEVTVTPRTSEQPYQVNLFVGGLEAIDNVYSASVVGCY